MAENTPAVEPTENTPAVNTPANGSIVNASAEIAKLTEAQQKQQNGLITRKVGSAQEKIFKELGFTDIDGAKDGFKQFTEWQESQKTETEKNNDAIKGLTDTNTTLTSENVVLNAKLEAIAKGVNADSAELGRFTALANTFEGDTISEKMDKALKAYPMFLKGTDQATTPEKVVFGGDSRNGAVNGADAVRAQMRAAAGLKN